MDITDTFVLLDDLEAIATGGVVLVDDGYSSTGVKDETRINLSDYLRHGLVAAEPETGAFAERYVHLTPEGVDAVELAKMRVREHLRRM